MRKSCNGPWFSKRFVPQSETTMILPTWDLNRDTKRYLPLLFQFRSIGHLQFYCISNNALNTSQEQDIGNKPTCKSVDYARSKGKDHIPVYLFFAMPSTHTWDHMWTPCSHVITQEKLCVFKTAGGVESCRRTSCVVRPKLICVGWQNLVPDAPRFLTPHSLNHSHLLLWQNNSASPDVFRLLLSLTTGSGGEEEWESDEIQYTQSLSASVCVCDWQQQMVVCPGWSPCSDESGVSRDRAGG